MRVVIVGAGSLGSAIGGLLGLSGHHVTLVTRNAAHVSAISRAGGVWLDDGTERVLAPVTAATDYGDVGIVDLAVVLVKSFDTVEAVRAALPVLAADTMVLSLQNGVGCEDLISDVVGRERVVAGRTFIGGRLIEPGVVEFGAVGRQTTIGELDGRRTERIDELAAVFTRAGLAASVSDDIRVTMWEKLFVNVATGAWSALTGLPYGELSVEPHVARSAIATVAEAMAVARSLGVAVTTDDPQVPWRRAWEGLPYGFKASMLQSIEKGSRTEVDVIHGAVISGGLEAGVPTPINDTLYAAVKGLERRLVLRSWKDRGDAS
jgi:2-dehydropantoate 2-reductase